jgi:hypothetical protein
VSRDKNNHLGEELIIRFLIDENDVPEAARRHLAACPVCRGEKENLEQDLLRFGRVAKQYSPVPKRRISLPERSRRDSISWFWNWQAASGMGAIAAIILVVISWNTLFRVQPEFSPDAMNQELIAAEELMTEVDILVNNALPAVYQDISGELYLEVDEEFIDYIVPAAYEDVSRFDDGKTKVGGEKLC